MKKSDLKTGMVVELKDGDKMVVLLNTINGDLFKSINKGTAWDTLRYYDEDLKNNQNLGLDVMKVYRYMHEYRYLGNEKLELIWEREKPTKEISSTEAFAILKKHYGCDVKISEVEQ